MNQGRGPSKLGHRLTAVLGQSGSLACPCLSSPGPRAANPTPQTPRSHHSWASGPTAHPPPPPGSGGHRAAQTAGERTPPSTRHSSRVSAGGWDGMLAATQLRPTAAERDRTGGSACREPQPCRASRAREGPAAPSPPPRPPPAPPPRTRVSAGLGQLAPRPPRCPSPRKRRLTQLPTGSPAVLVPDDVLGLCRLGSAKTERPFYLPLDPQCLAQLGTRS